MTKRLETTGGPAFPFTDESYVGPYQGCLSKLDYFAAAALTGLLAVGDRVVGPTVVREAYDLAKFMLVERDKRDDPRDLR